ncbi:hypothetical protein DICPUDRAFT_151984 [Dictyostelium purpureum]|uniref:Uncharacterized protein n=1 Tax=Dictyostelium purpureum TaxID=5786 RepID=F0ZK73_DICPU|nr:uncharacterized protein DICPUDRAFT_151984 [Dictyostelium purpureum]EGC35650.1 hypothetical protein DICPUDRAFT_151984 [Dictyostelium purpureum]|eukprot:XP_003287829.1 hypothetical protein DICPUDRAFT_151984 [Dictyostelium purpureum]
MVTVLRKQSKFKKLSSGSKGGYNGKSVYCGISGVEQILKEYYLITNYLPKDISTRNTCCSKV